MLGAIAGGKGSVKIINDCYFHDCINCCAEILGPSNAQDQRRADTFAWIENLVPVRCILMLGLIQVY
jgi:hypothetical protein